jgi:hypothetical protein
MRRFFCLVVLLLMYGSATYAETTGPLCVLDPDKVPPSWRPPAKLKKLLNPAPWSEAEAKDAQYAIEKGVDEMISYLERKPSAVESVGADAIEALIQVTYASANAPAFDAKVRDAARKHLTTLIDLALKRRPDPGRVTCGDFRSFLPLAIFAHELYPAGEQRTAEITKRVNAAYRTCGSFEAATDVDLRKTLARKRIPPTELLELYIWALWFVEAEAHPAIELPAEARGYPPALWKYFETYRLAGASEFEEGPWDDKFIAMADLAPHIAHMPTATHRSPLYVEDLPSLYRFHRENFYAVMQVNELDLFASFVDTLRQYGCTPENDMQVRDGTRYLLGLFHGGKDSWMAFRQDGQTDADLTDYDLMHYPWTAVLAIRDRKLEPPQPGSVGAIVRGWLPPPRRGN